MSLSSGKASGKTWPRPCPNCGSPIPATSTGDLEKRIAELEAEVERLKSLLQKKATPRTDWSPTEEERKILDFALSRLPKEASP